MKQHQNTIGETDVWLTPRWILSPLGNFDLDPCAPEIQPWRTATWKYTEADDGLSKPWQGRVWLNPPFNRYERPKWMRKMAEHGHGTMLIPAACETEPFKRYVWGSASAVLFLNRRPHFCLPDGTEAKANSGCTICLVAYGREDADILAASGLGVTVTDWIGEKG